MTTAIDDFDSASDAFAFADWALQSGIWNGREVSWTEASEFCEEVQSRILETLFNSQNEAVFDQFASQLAWIGNSGSRDLIARDIQALDFSTNPLIVHARLGKSLTKFWKKHKKEILIGTAVLAVVTVVVVVAVIAGSGAAAAAAGGAALEGLKKQDGKPDSNRDEKPALSKTPILPSPEKEDDSWKENLLADSKVHFGEKAVLINGQYSTYEDILKAPIKEPLIGSSPPYQPKLPALPVQEWDKSWLAKTCEAIERKVIYPEALDLPKTIPPEGRSCCISSSTPRSSHLRIAGINGMDTSYEEAVSHVKYLQNFTPKHCIDWVYNRSHGPIIDLAEIFTLNYAGASPNTSQLLAENWMAFHKENLNRPDLKYLQFCHSQGALHVRNALGKLPKEIRDRIMVVAIAPAGIVPDEICYKSFNYASKKDIVHFGELVYSGGLDSTECGISKKLEMILEYRDQLILLDPHPDAKGIDHEFQSPTFNDVIQKRINEYINQKGLYK